MKKTAARPSTLFLMELIISILFFSLAAAVCVQFLAKSHTISRSSSLLRNAEEHCTSVAEMLIVSDGMEDFYGHITELIRLKTEDEEGHLKCSLSDIPAAIDTDSGSISSGTPDDEISTSELSTSFIDVFFDSEWKECPPEDSAYVLHTVLTSDGRMLTGDICLIEYTDYHAAVNAVPDSEYSESYLSEGAAGCFDSVYSLHVTTHIQKEVQP